MPPEYPLLTDDYVAQLVTDEARDCSIKYSSIGLDAFKSNKRPSNQPKPNTRFLNNIIRDTNTHNRAILAKENAESQARLRHLDHTEYERRQEEERRLRRSRPGASDTRKRMLGDIAAIIGGSSKTRNDKEIEPVKREWRDRRDRDHRRSRSPQAKHDSHRHKGHRERSPATNSSRRHRERSPAHRDNKRAKSDRGPDHTKNKPRELFPESGSSHRESRRRHSRHEDRSRSPARRKHRHTSSSVRDNRRVNPRGETPSLSNHEKSDDSDPLDDLIGPTPAPTSPIRRRGRGAHVTRDSGIDSHFAPDYDPRADVVPDVDEEADDWDNAVEAYRDQQKWKQQGADRLRSAGFTEDEIQKWEKGGDKDEADVRWNTLGGVREWDRGKVVGDDGHVSHKAEWAT